MESVWAIIPEFSQTPEVYETAEEASVAMGRIAPPVRDRYRVEEVPIRKIGVHPGPISYRFAVTYRTDEGIFHVGPAGLNAKSDHRPPKAFTHLLYSQRAHVFLFSVDASDYEEALSVVNNIVALFSLIRQVWGPMSVEIDGEAWSFDEDRGFYKEEAPAQ